MSTLEKKPSKLLKLTFVTIRRERHDRILEPSEQNELYHFGVMGMKWGKHLKAAGEAAYGVAGGAAEEEYEKALADLEDPNALERNGEDKWNKVIEAEKKWLTSPLGRIKNAKRRFSELKYDIILDDASVKKQN